MNVEISSNEDKPLIAHVLYRFQAGGMENGLVNLVNGLPESRYRHAIICLAGFTEFAERITTNNVTFHDLNKKPGKDLGLYFRFWCLLRQINPTILHTRNLGTVDLAPIAAIAGVPIRIHGEHGWDVRDSQGSSSKYKIIRRCCDRFLVDYVAVSGHIRRWLEISIRIKTHKIRQIYNGVDTKRFYPDRASFDLPFALPLEGLFVIGAVGRMDPIKNFQLLVSSVASLFNKLPNSRDYVRLVIAGSGPELSELKEMVITLGLEDIVWFPGHNEDVSALLRCLSVFVLPSLNEGLSNTILESMATGLPVIATDVGGNAELVVDGETGLLVNSGDGAALTSALIRYIEESGLCGKHGAAGRRRVIDDFSLSTMLDKYAAMYDEHLSSRNSKLVDSV